MGIFNRMIPNITRNEYGEIVSQPYVEPQVNDIFDPLFNAEVKQQLYNKYGHNPFANIMGYGDLVENVIFQKNGAGILKSLGRSMDKADDFILGGLTEGTKLLTGQGFENPIRNIFVEDQNYTGERLLAAMGNSMRHLAGGTTLDESDFNGAWALPSTGIDLITDPGILGGTLMRGAKANAPLAEQLSKQYASTPLYEAGQAMSKYDDIMGEITGNIVVPGGRFALNKARNKIMDLVGSRSPKDTVEVILNAEEDDSIPPEVVDEARQRAASDPEISMANEAITALENLKKQHANDVLGKLDLASMDNKQKTDFVLRWKHLQESGDYDEEDVIAAYEDSIRGSSVVDPNNPSFTFSKYGYGRQLQELQRNRDNGLIDETTFRRLKRRLDGDAIVAKRYQRTASAISDSFQNYVNYKRSNQRMGLEKRRKYNLANLQKSIQKDLKTMNEDAAPLFEYFQKKSRSGNVSPNIGRSIIQGLDDLDDATLVARYREAWNTQNLYEKLNPEYAGWLPDPKAYDDYYDKYYYLDDKRDEELAADIRDTLTLELDNAATVNMVYSALGIDPKSRGDVGLSKDTLTVQDSIYKRWTPKTWKNAVLVADDDLDRVYKEFLPDDIQLNATDSVERVKDIHNLKKTLYDTISLKLVFPDKAIREKFVDDLVDVRFYSGNLSVTDYFNKLQDLTDAVENYAQPVQHDGITDAVLELGRAIKEDNPDMADSDAIEQAVMNFAKSKEVNDAAEMHAKKMVHRAIPDIHNSSLTMRTNLNDAEAPRKDWYNNTKAFEQDLSDWRKVYYGEFHPGRDDPEISERMFNKWLSEISDNSEYSRRFARLFNDYRKEYDIKTLNQFEEAYDKVSIEEYAMNRAIMSSTKDMVEKIERASFATDAENVNEAQRVYNSLQSSIDDLRKHVLVPMNEQFHEDVTPTGIGYWKNVEIPENATQADITDEEVGSVNEEIGNAEPINDTNGDAIEAYQAYADAEAASAVHGVKNGYGFSKMTSLKKEASDKKYKTADEMLDDVRRVDNTFKRNGDVDYSMRNVYSYSIANDINMLIRKNPEVMQDEEFVDILRKLSKHYEIKIPAGVKLPNYDPDGIFEKFLQDTYSLNGKSYNLMQLAEKSAVDGYSYLFSATGKVPPKGTPSRILYDVLGYNGTKGRSPYWREYRELLKELVPGKFENGKFVKLPHAWDIEHLTNEQIDSIEHRFISKVYLNDYAPQLYLSGGKTLDASMKDVSSVYADTDQVMDAAKQERFDKRFNDTICSLVQKMPKPADAAKTLYDTQGTAADKITEFQNALNGDNPDGAPMGENPDMQSSQPKSLRRWSLHTDNIAAARQAVSNNNNKNYATLRQKKAQDLLTDVGKHYGDDLDDDTIYKYRLARQAQEGDVIQGKTLLTDLVGAKGINTFSVAQNDKATADALEAYLKNVTQAVNGQVKAKVLKTDMVVLPNKNKVFRIYFDFSNKNVVNDLYKMRKKIDLSKLADFTVIEKGTQRFPELEGSSNFKYLDGVFGELDGMEKDYAKMLGFDYSDTGMHIKNVYTTDVDVADTFANYIYNGVNLDALNQISDSALDIPEYGDVLRGAMGSVRIDKRIRGMLDLYESGMYEEKGKTYDLRLFTNDPREIIKGTLTGGMFENKKFQTTVELFFNDNFNVHHIAKDPDELIKVFYPNGENNTANLYNMALVSPRYSSDGRIIGMKRFDKLSKQGFEQAWKDENCILVPESIISPLDRVLRKEQKMSNKAFAFINRNLTIPFKFGVLINPGFLLGNVSDAYLKAATTMSEKYGTTVSEELANVGVSIRDTMQLNNDFDEVYTKIVNDLDAHKVPLKPSDRISSLAYENTRMRQLILDYMQSTVKDPLQTGGKQAVIACKLSDKEIAQAKLWMLLNSEQTTTSFAEGLQDFDDIAKASNSNEYALRKNLWQRVTMGKGNYDKSDFTTWGLCLNNPVASKAMQLSGNIENLMRSSCILNDLRHHGKSSEELVNLMLLATDPDNPQSAKLRTELKISLDDAINAMSAANFDYEQVTDFTDSVGTFMPFPTFYLKNFGYWMDLFVNNPQYVENTIKIQEGLWRSRGKKNDEKDEFMEDAKYRGAIPNDIVTPGIGGQKLSNLFKGIYKPTPQQSMFGAFGTLNDPLGDAAFRLHPAIANTGIAAANTFGVPEHLKQKMAENGIKYRPYTTNPYEKNVSFGDPNFNNLSFAIHRTNPYERAMSTAMRLPAKMRMNTTQVSDFLPSVFQPDFSKK